MVFNKYETEELYNWILNDEYYFNKVMEALKSFDLFVEVVKRFIKVLNKAYDFLSFKTYEINFKDLFNDLKDY